MTTARLNVPISSEHYKAEISQELLLYAARLETGITSTQARVDATAYIQYVIVDDQGNAIQADHTTRLYAETFEHCFKVGRHLSIITPPGFGKTTLALSLMTRAIGRNPKLRTVVVTADEKDSINAVTLARSIVLTASFSEVFPAAKPDIEKSTDARGWRQTHWYMKAAGMRKDPTMSAVPMEPKKESIRVDMGLFDDMVTEATADGEIHERICKRFYTTWIEGRCSPNGWAIYQQNVRRLNDLAHRLREDPKFCSVWIGVNPDCESMFVHVWNPPPDLPLLKNPERYDAVQEDVPEEHPLPTARFVMPLPNRPGWSPERIRGVSLSARRQLYYMKAVSSEDLVIPNWTNRIQFPGTAAQMCGLEVDDEGFPIMDELARLRFSVVAGVDLSSPRRPGTVLWVLLKDMEGHYYPLYLNRGKWTIGDLAFQLNRLHENGVHIERLHFENNGVQDMVLKSLDEHGAKEDLPWRRALVGQTTNFNNKWGLALGLPSLDKDFEDGMVHWPTGEKNTGRDWARHWHSFEMVMETVTRDVADSSKCPDDLMAFLFARQAGRNLYPYPRKSRKPLTKRLNIPEDEIISGTKQNGQGRRKKKNRFDY